MSRNDLSSGPSSTLKIKIMDFQYGEKDRILREGKRKSVSSSNFYYSYVCTLLSYS